jgi:hypothetical protein
MCLNVTKDPGVFIFKDQVIQERLEYLRLESESSTLNRNVGTPSSNDTKSHPKSLQFLATL